MGAGLNELMWELLPPFPAASAALLVQINGSSRGRIAFLRKAPCW
jgi:hypothetical protein